jgi:hypothetical protein
MTPTEPIVMVCGNGIYFRSTPSLSTNTYTFMFANKYVITTFDNIRIQKEMAAKNALKRSQTAQELFIQS